jgi:DegV family protein with EDD domain
MANVCILTDSTAQFVQPNFPGHERVFAIPFELQNGEELGGDGLSSLRKSRQRLIPPSPSQFVHFYEQLSRNYDSIMVLPLSSQLNPVMKNAILATQQFSNNSTVEVVDSQTTGVGLGMLVQVAAGAASQEVPIAEISRRIRIAIPRVYSLFCIPDLTVLAQSGYMEWSQAIAGEMMGLLPIFAIEEGRLAPMEKVRTPRHLFEAFQDFMSEFESPTHIVLVQGQNHNTLRARPLKLFMQENFPEAPFALLSLQPHLSALLGTQATGLFVSEMVDEN